MKRFDCSPKLGNSKGGEKVKRMKEKKVWPLHGKPEE